MARTPQELLKANKSRVKAVADNLEKRIDAQMDQSYSGGEFEFSVQNEIAFDVIVELRTRYLKWSISTNCGSDMNEAYTTLNFKPME